MAPPTKLVRGPHTECQTAESLLPKSPKSGELSPMRPELFASSATKPYSALRLIVSSDQITPLGVRLEKIAT
ncbi:MAG: hypothetical protein JWN70_4631 [Planctomycetaceae bacterium]|nr:hypothetical protein [Planctomycetaceae bacterium]